MNKSNLRIGWASRDVTPSKKVNLAGQFHMRIASEVRDPVTVTALTISSPDALEDSVIFVSCDLVGVPAFVVDECRKKISEQAKDFPVNNLVLNATHTHTAPDIKPGAYDYEALSQDELNGLIRPETYRSFLVDKIVETALESWRNRKEGSIAWGIGFAVVGHNRRTVYLKDFSERPDFQESPGWEIKTNASMYGITNDPWFSHMEGYEDHSVQFLFTFDTNEKLTGSVINLVCPSQETEGISQISADFWHDVRVSLREKYGQNFFILPQCATAGDQSPHLMLNKKAEERRLKLKGLEPRKEIAWRIVSAFDETLSWAKKDIQASPQIKHICRDVNLSQREVSEEEHQKNKKWIKQLESKQSGKVNFLSINRCREVVRKYESQQKGLDRVQPVEIHVIRLGEIAFATNPFELFLDYGTRIQARSPAVQTFTVQLAGRGVEGGGTYLSAERSAKGGGYSACVYCNPVGFKGGQELVEETLKAINELWNNDR
jgi:hypothetical protein